MEEVESYTDMYRNCMLENQATHTHLILELENAASEDERKEVMLKLETNKVRAFLVGNEFAMMYNMEEMNAIKSRLLGTVLYEGNGTRTVYMGRVPEGYVYEPCPKQEEKKSDQIDFISYYKVTNKRIIRKRISRYIRKAVLKQLSWHWLGQKHKARKLQRKRKAFKLHLRRLGSH